MSEVTVIGLGNMGSALARVLQENGRAVTVWNRSPEKATSLVEKGAILAPSAAAALTASPIVIVCVTNYTAANRTLGVLNAFLWGDTMPGLHPVVGSGGNHTTTGEMLCLGLKLRDPAVLPPAAEKEHHAGPLVGLFPVGRVVDNKFQIALLRLLVDEGLGVLLRRSPGSRHAQQQNGKKHGCNLQ